MYLRSSANDLLNPMNAWSNNLGRFLFILLWLFLICLPMFAFILATRQEIKIGNDQNNLRIFLIQEADLEGIGLESSRLSPSRPSCTQTNVKYLMWVGEPENVTFCLCVDPETGYSLPAIQGTCHAP